MDFGIYRPEAFVDDMDYRDDGCALHPACLTCPRQTCWEDLTRAQKEREQRDALPPDARILQLTQAQAAAELGISRRTIARRRTAAYDELRPCNRAKARLSDQRARKAGAMLRAGRTRGEIAAGMGLTQSGVVRLLQRPAAGELPPGRTSREQNEADARALRAEGLTHAEIGARLGVTRPSATRLINGRRAPSAAPREPSEVAEYDSASAARGRLRHTPP